MSFGISNFRSFPGKTDISCCWSGETFSKRGTASANLMPDGTWWINRVLVQPEECRGKGIGGKLLGLLIEEIHKQGGRKIIVCPGGYGSDMKRVTNFYKKHGFKDNKKQLQIIKED